ncbi:MAG: VWA domain-containing protein [Deltaproteobacteria bacterium]|nr:VWA domain-containing protein [Deltaproteobacteria bacterium]
MLDLIIRFSKACRSAGMRVSTSEVIDSVKQLEYIDVTDENRFKYLLRANFAKSRREQKNFDRLYDLFFHEKEPEKSPDPALQRHAEIRELIESFSGDAGQTPIDAALKAFLKGNPIPYITEMQRLETKNEYTPKGLKSNLGQLSSRLEVMLRINAMRNRLLNLPAQSGENAPEARHRAVDHLLKRLDAAYGMLTEESTPYNDGLKQIRTHKKHYSDIGERPFSSLSPREVAEMRDVIKQMIRKLKDRASRRWAARNKGVIDVRKTLRYAGRFQGIPIDIKYRNKRLRKAKIVTLCDVSGSVWSAARFMLNMLYSMQDCFSSVNSFAFVCATTDVTEIFEKNEVNQAIEKVMSNADIDFNALTDYGEVFFQFKRDHIHLLNKKTTIIIVGDGRSNYHNPRQDILAEMREKCRRIIWLNPEPEAFWGTGDSEMNTFKAFCHEVRPCRNLNQLIDFVEDLVM